MNIKDIITESQHTCPHCGGPLVEYSGLMEKKDACYYKVKASAKVWPSAYASGRLVQCRKKGAANYGNKSESVAEGFWDSVKAGWHGDVDFGLDDRKVYKVYINGKDVSSAMLSKAEAIEGVKELASEEVNSNTEYHIVNTRTKKIEGHYTAKQFYKESIKQGVAEAQLDEKCWDTHKQVGMKNKGGRQVPDCRPKESVSEGAMPASVIRIKEKIRLMSDAEKKEYFRGKTQEQLQQMARRHGYGENSNVYAKYATESVTEGAEQEILFYAKIPDGSRVYARVKDEEQIARLQQQYRAAEIKTFDFRRPDILDWLEARGINLRKFAPGMVQTMYPGSRGHNESKGLNEFAPGAGGDDEAGDDPYKYPKPKRYNRSADYFEQFEADHFDREDFDDDTGVFKGYWGNTQIAYFKFDNPARTGGNNPGMGWYYEPQTNNRGDDTAAAPAADDSEERKQQELSMINAFLKSGNRPNPDSQIGRLMKKHGMTGDLNEFAPYSSDDDGNDGFSDDTLKRLAAQWWQGDEDPRVEQTLAAAGWEIGQDEGYDEGGVFVVQAGDVNGRSYISWPAQELEGLAETTDPEIEEMYEAMQQLAEEMAASKGVSVDLVWESFEALDDHMLYETAAWRRKEGKSKKGGLNAKGVASYRRENPGSKLQMAVTTKPSKLKKGSKAAKRRKSFCARMGGVKGPMKKPNGKPTRKALALRKWNC